MYVNEMEVGVPYTYVRD